MTRLDAEGQAVLPSIVALQGSLHNVNAGNASRSLRNKGDKIGKQ
ncbi:hypothetical protein BRPE64_ECDS01590 (plasmid) [Caballeronia insecticola]|uniref:Uncharacterized protein n=1 Tax=Caballeronia insecticola TaxID=758793 RepID=A0A060PKE3_9BURK|nr:hypothetical protein BRPE64_ECDS01590 [Caballeronia insecticola]